MPDLKFRERFEGMKSEKILTKIGFKFGPISGPYGGEVLGLEMAARCCVCRKIPREKPMATEGVFKWSTGIKIILHPFPADNCL